MNVKIFGILKSMSRKISFSAELSMKKVLGPVFGVSEQLGLNTACSVTEDS